MSRGEEETLRRRLLRFEESAPAGPPPDDLPSFYGSSKHSFESLAFSVYRLLLRDVKGPLGFYVVSTQHGRRSSGSGRVAGNDEVQSPDVHDPHMGISGSRRGAIGEAAFPCPPPYGWPGVDESGGLVGKAEQGRRLWVNLLVCALSFREQGEKGQAPYGCQVGDPITEISSSCPFPPRASC